MRLRRAGHRRLLRQIVTAQRVRPETASALVDHDFGADELTLDVGLEQPASGVAEPDCVAVNVVDELVRAPGDGLMRVAEDDSDGTGTRMPCWPASCDSSLRLCR